MQGVGPPRPATRVVVIGEALVDEFPDGEVVGGAPFNVARNLAALGEAPLMITRIGADANGERIEHEFDRFGLSRVGLQHDASLPTGRVRVDVGAGGHRFTIADRAAWDAIDPEAAAGAVRGLGVLAVAYGTLAQRRARSRAAVRRSLEASTAWHLLDLNLRPPYDDRTVVTEALALARCVKVNQDELDRLGRWFAPTGGDAAAGEADAATVAALIEAFALDHLVVTCGEDGFEAWDASGPIAARTARRDLEVVDTVGAGDAFSSVLLLGHLHAWPLPVTLERAGAFASAVCTVRGAIADDDGFYRAWRRRWGLGTPDTSARHASAR